MVFLATPLSTMVARLDDVRARERNWSMQYSGGNQDAEAWTHYWAKGQESSPGCLPGLAGPAAESLAALWRQFFLELPLGASVLDMGTGSGTLLALARDCRPDLVLSGIDYAAQLPDPGPGIALHPQTRMEALPFADHCFDAITSQFAIEYGAISEIIKEIRRVLRKGGRYRFLCHHREGVIVRDNSARLSAIRGLLANGGLIETAIKALRQRQKNSPKTRQRLARIFDAALRKYPHQSVLHEVAGDIARIMTETNSLEGLLRLRRDVEREGRRIEALQNAALTEKSARELAIGMTLEPGSAQLDVIHVPGSALPFAWRLTDDQPSG